MKLSLEVLTPGKAHGKIIPVAFPQFLIGRDPQCQLRPASAVVSKRHCALLVKGNQVFVRDFGSMNGTFVNDQPVKAEAEVKNGDQLKIGPLVFGIRLEVSVAANKPAKIPAPVLANAGDDDSIAAMLLAQSDDDGPSTMAPVHGSDSLMSESTVMDLPKVGPTDETDEGPAKKDDKAKVEPAKPASMIGNTSTAAEAILQKYMRRPRA